MQIVSDKLNIIAEVYSVFTIRGAAIMQYRELSKKHPRSLKIYENACIQAFFEELGLLDQMPPSIVVAGTNGKGSVCRILEEIYTCQGYRVGCFVTPHLLDFKERIRLNGSSISSQYFKLIYEKSKDLLLEFERRYARPMTFFEMMILISVGAFSSVDVVIIEVGLGGARDATRVFNPVLNLFTSISLDHCHILGNTIEQIQKEKLGILKSGAQIITTPEQQEQLGASTETNVEIQYLNSESYVQKFLLNSDLGCGEIRTNLLGEYQLQNIQLSLQAVIHLRSILNVSFKNMIRALNQVKHPCRLEWIHPRILIDGSHNLEGWSKLKDYLIQMDLIQNSQWAVCLKKTKSIDQLSDFIHGDPLCFNPRNTSFFTPGILAQGLGGRACYSFIQVFDEWFRDSTKTLVVTGSLSGAARLKRSLLKLLDRFEKNASHKYSARTRIT